MCPRSRPAAQSASAIAGPHEPVTRWGEENQVFAASRSVIRTKGGTFPVGRTIEALMSCVT